MSSKSPIPLFNPLLLHNKCALVTGGASGIGEQIVKSLLYYGANVYIIGRRGKLVDDKVKELNVWIGGMWKERYGSVGDRNVPTLPTINGTSCDIRHEQQVIKAIDNIKQLYGGIDILINAAAGNFLASLSGLSVNAFKTVLMIDTVGTFIVSKLVVQRGRRIVISQSSQINKGQTQTNLPPSLTILNISASLHYNGTILQTHSGTAKAGVDALTRHLSVQLGPYNVRVVGICPGIIGQTQGYQRLSMGIGEEKIKRVIPLQRVGKKADIANGVVFLVSQAASYVTGIMGVKVGVGLNNPIITLNIKTIPYPQTNNLGTTLIIDGGQSLSMPNFPFIQIDQLPGYGAKPKL